jgi:hypothetical protein
MCVWSTMKINAREPKEANEWTTPREADGPHPETQMDHTQRHRWTTHRDTVSIGYKIQSEENQEWTTPRHS